MASLKVLQQHLRQLKACNQCPEMIRPVVVGSPALSKVMLIGQAPGVKEGQFGKPFAWTAGKTMFKWFSSIGITEDQFRERVYMAAVCRCFPGKAKSGSGDRVPSPLEIQNCSSWLHAELALLKPRLVIPVGKLAISQFFDAVGPLNEIIGHKFSVKKQISPTLWLETEVIPLPHPSGASPWHRMSPGNELLEKALKLIKQHPDFSSLID